jgi:hypothetical protein
MPESPEQIPDSYAVLPDLKHDLGNAAQITGYVLDLKSSADRLLPLIAMSLRLLSATIERVLPILPCDSAEEGRGDA